MPPKWMPLQQRLFNSQRETYFCWNLMPPKPMPFMSKMLSTLNLFCLTQCPPKWMPLWKMLSMWNLFFWSKMHPKWMPFVTAVLNAKLFLVSHGAPHMDAFGCLFCQRYCQHWIFFVWHIAPEIDDGRCSQCQPFVSFVQVLEKTLWNALSFENPFGRAILQAKRSPALWNKGPPEWARALFLGWRINCPTHIQNHFQGFWLFHLALAVYPDPAKSFQKCSLSLEIWNLFRTTF